MATVNDILDRNPHREAFNSIIQYLNEANNPYENALVANLIYNRLSNWGAGKIPMEPPPVLSGADGFGASVANANYQEDPQVGAYVIRQAAVNENAGDPLTAPIVSFRNYLDGIAMNVANAWVDFNLAVDVFYEVIDPFSYFASVYKNGSEKSLFLDVLGLYERPGIVGNGIQVNTVEDGVDGVAARAAITSIFCDTVALGDAGSYFTHVNDSNNASRLIVWFEVNGAGSAPSLPAIAGVTDIVIKVTLTDALSASEVRSAITSAIRDQSGFSIGRNPVEPAFRLINFMEVPVIESEFSLPSSGDWNGLFTQGTNAQEGTPELIQVQYGGAIASELGGRYFQLSNDTASRFAIVGTFWYNVDGNDIQPTIPGTTVYREIAISSSDDISRIQALTDEAIESAVKFGGWRLAQRKGCCSLFTIGGNPPAPNNGTAALYTKATTTMRSAGDNSVIDTVNEADFKQWANTNNSLRAVYDSAFEESFYLVPLGGIGKYFNNAKNGALQNVYRFFPFNIEVDGLQYNQPGVQWNNQGVNKTRDKKI